MLLFSIIDQNLLNIDDLLQGFQSTSSASSTTTAPKPFKPKSVINKTMTGHNNAALASIVGSSNLRRPLATNMRTTASAPNRSISSNQASRGGYDEDHDHFVSYDNQTTDDDYHDSSAPLADDYEPTDTYHSPVEKASLSQTTSSGEANAVVSPGNEHTDTTTTDTAAPATQKISLSKTTKKLVFTEPPKPGIQRSADGSTVFKPMLGDNTLSLGLADINGAGSAVNSGSSDSTATLGTTEIRSGVIDPKYWLHKTVKAETDATTVLAIPKVDNSDPETTTTAGISTTTGTAVEGTSEEYINMFWLDACESHGVIYLFGKLPVNEPGIPIYHVSCCVAVHGAERNLFVLPRKTDTLKTDGTAVRVGMAEVHSEIHSMLVPHIIPRSSGQSFRCKAVKRKYAFEHGDVPREETEYMKVVYSAKHPSPSLTECNKGGKFIERVFGATSSALELFLLKRRLMGPCWIKIRNPRTITDSSLISWCKIEIGVENPKFITKLNEPPPTPPLVSMCVSMKTVLNPSTHLHEIVAISGLIHNKMEGDKDTELDVKNMKRFSIVRPLGLTCGNNYPTTFPHDLDTEFQKINNGGAANNKDTKQTSPSIPVIQKMPNERALLGAFFARVQQEDPDIFASHNLFGFEFDVLLSRAVANKVNEWSRVGRMRRSKLPKNINEKDISSGRILCDTYKAAKEFLRETTYSLTSLSMSQLGIDRVEVDPVDVPKYFSNTQDIIKIVNHTACDAILVQKLVLKLQIVPLTKQLTNLSGNLFLL